MDLFEALHQARPQGQLHPAAECRGPVPGPGLLLAGPGRHVGASAGGQHDPGLGGAAAAGEGAVPRPRPRPRPAPLLRRRVRCSCVAVARDAGAGCTLHMLHAPNRRLFVRVTEDQNKLSWEVYFQLQHIYTDGLICLPSTAVILSEEKVHVINLG